MNVEGRAEHYPYVQFKKSCTPLDNIPLVARMLLRLRHRFRIKTSLLMCSRRIRLRNTMRLRHFLTLSYHDRFDLPCADLAPTRGIREASESLNKAIFLFRSFQLFVANLFLLSSFSSVECIIFLSAG